MKNLVIIESEFKKFTIEKILGPDYTIISSGGHICDLSKKGKFRFGFDVENFIPDYQLLKKKEKQIKSLKKHIKNKKYKNIYLATDPDREGETIAYLIVKEFNIDHKRIKRVLFNEITKTAILKSFKNPIELNINLIHAQQTRRFLDRMVGFMLSRFLWYTTKARSAGRVQSLILHWIIEREKEIEAFKPKKTYSISASSNKKLNFFFFIKENKKKVVAFESKKVVEEYLKSIKNQKFSLFLHKVNEKPKKPLLPLKTSTLLQYAFTNYNYSLYKTTNILKILFEGVKINGEYVGLITYPRTDSIRLSDVFVKALKKLILKNYSKTYLSNTILKTKKTKTKVQDAHEAIRPTTLKYSPEKIKNYLTSEQYKLYRLIYYRTLAVFIKPPITKHHQLTYSFKEYFLEGKYEELVFDGYFKLLPTKEKFFTISEKQLKEIKFKNFIVEENITKPKPRYNQASIIKKMELTGVGRPSTYSTFLYILVLQNYVKVIKKTLFPSLKGVVVNKILINNFDFIINENYTSNFELVLDDISNGKKKYLEWLKSFWTEFYKKYEVILNKFKAFTPKDYLSYSETKLKCKECKAKLLIKYSSITKNYFFGCKNYPECRFTLSYFEQKNLIPPIPKEAKKVKENCPKCKSELVIKHNLNRLQYFLACPKFPKCMFTKSLKLPKKEKKL